MLVFKKQTKTPHHTNRQNKIIKNKHPDISNITEVHYELEHQKMNANTKIIIYMRLFALYTSIILTFFVFFSFFFSFF